MSVRVLFLAAVLTAAAPAAAQVLPEGDGTSGESAPTAAPTPPGAWPVYPTERHILVRAEATTAARLSDPFSLGALAPVSVFVEGTYLLLHGHGFLEGFQFGPSLGFQAGFDPSGSQFTIQPGFAAYRRFSPAFAMTARIDVPILVTGGDCGLLPPVAATSNPGMGTSANVNLVQVPNTGFCPTTAVGVEAAVGAAYYVRAGIAVTAEITFDYYFGDGHLGYPLLGGGLGLLFDYEVLP